MILTVNKGVLKYELSFKNLTQLCGMNIPLKEYLLNSIKMHFSTTKHRVQDSLMVDNIRIDGIVPGRKEYQVVEIANREDLLKQISFSKASALNEFSTDSFKKLEFEEQLFELEKVIDKVYKMLNKELIVEGSSLMLTYRQSELWNLVQESTVITKTRMSVEEMSNAELLNEFFLLFKSNLLKKPNSYILVLKDLDHLLSTEQYRLLLDEVIRLCFEHDVFIIITTSIEGYAYLNENTIEGVNVINDEIFSFTNSERLVDYLRWNYPVEISSWDELLYDKLLLRIHDIGRNQIIDYSADVVLNLLNNTVGKEATICGKLKAAELAFLEEKT